MTDLNKARIDVSLQTPDGKLENCHTIFSVDNLKADLDAIPIAKDQQVGTMTCDDLSSYTLVKADDDSIIIKELQYEITLTDEDAYLILTPPKTATSLVAFDYKSEEAAAKYNSSPLLVKIEFNPPQEVGGKKITSHYKRFDNLAAFTAWLPEEATGTVKGVWAMQTADSVEKPVWLDFDTKDERDTFLSGGEGFVMITRKAGAEDSEPKTFDSAAALSSALAEINAGDASAKPDQVILIHLQNTGEENKLNATTYIDTPEKVTAYATYINEQEADSGFSLGKFDVQRRSWFERNGLDLRGRFGWSALFKQRQDYTLLNPDIAVGGIDEEYAPDYAAAQASKEDKKFYEGLGLGFGGTLYLGVGLGVGLNFDWSRMKASWMDLDTTNGSEFDRIMLDLELRWSMARSFQKFWKGFEYFDPQISASLGYGHVWGDTTLQESFNPIDTKLDFGFGTLGLDVPITVCDITDNWKFQLGPYVKGVFPFAEKFRDPRYGSTGADIPAYFETGAVATFSYQNTTPDKVTPTLEKPEYVKPDDLAVDLKSDKTVPEPKGPVVPGFVELPPPNTEKITIQANFKTGLLDLNAKDAGLINEQLAKIKAIVKPGFKYVIRVDGHADSRGTWDKNERLSMGRANEYKNLLIAAAVKQGDTALIEALSTAVIFVSGKGESQPLTPDGKVIDTSGLGDKAPVVKGSLGTLSNGVVEDLDKSRRIELSFEALEPGAPVPLPPEISPTQKAADKEVADAIARTLTGGAIEGAYYDEGDNSLNVVLNGFAEKDLKKAKALFLKQVKAVQRSKKASLSSQCIVRFVMHGNPTQPEQDLVKGFYKFNEWPTAATFEYTLDASTQKKKAFIEELKAKTRQKVQESGARKAAIEAASFAVNVPTGTAGGTTSYQVFPIKVDPASGLPAVDKLIIARLIAARSLKPTFYYNFNAKKSDEVNYLKEIAGLAGDKRADVSRVYTSENPGARLDGEYLFLIVGDTQVDLSKADDVTAKAIREEIFKKVGPKKP